MPCACLAMCLVVLCMVSETQVVAATGPLLQPDPLHVSHVPQPCALLTGLTVLPLTISQSADRCLSATERDEAGASGMIGGLVEVQVAGTVTLGVWPCGQAIHSPGAWTSLLLSLASIWLRSTRDVLKAISLAG